MCVAFEDLVPKSRIYQSVKSGMPLSLCLCVCVCLSLLIAWHRDLPDIAAVSYTGNTSSVLVLRKEE